MSASAGQQRSQSGRGPPAYEAAHLEHLEEGRGHCAGAGRSAVGPRALRAADRGSGRSAGRRVRVGRPGFRTRVLVVATTLLDAKAFTTDDLARLYRARWHAELDLRSLKQVLQMDVLRCKTPTLVRKEIWAHILAYNLIRTVMAQAATRHGIEPRSISFKGALQTLEAFQPVIALRGGRDAAFRGDLYERVLEAVATHRVGDRPDRFERRPDVQQGDEPWPGPREIGGQQELVVLPHDAVDGEA